MTIETVSQVQRALIEEGFVEELVADGPELRVVSSGQRYTPGELVVARLIRFQGITTPEEEAVLFALATTEGNPLGTYAPPCRPALPAADAAIVQALHQQAIPEDELRSHGRHDHVAAVFDTRAEAEAAVAELRGLGLGSDRLGLAVREGAPHAFERNAETELVRDTEVGVATGTAIGFLAGMSIAAITLIPGGIIGLGGVLALGAAGGMVGAMLGGYVGEAAVDRAFTEREELSAAHLEPGQVLVAVCSHGHPATVKAVMQRHGGELVLRPRAR